MPLPVFIDSDNALGAPFGDIDDGFAIAALLKSEVSIAGLSSVFGNTFEPLAYRNNRALGEICGYRGPMVRGASTWWARESEAAAFLNQSSEKFRVLAIGPLTNLRLALAKKAELPISEVVFVGTNLSFPLPAMRFFDFNQWKDPRAMRALLRSSLPLTCVPCDVARKLRVTETQLEALRGDLGSYLRQHSKRWFVRAKVVKRIDSVPIWDLVAAIYLLRPDLFTTIETTLQLGAFGQATFGAPRGRRLKVVTDFDVPAVWNYFVTLSFR